QNRADSSNGDARMVLRFINESIDAEFTALITSIFWDGQKKAISRTEQILAMGMPGWFSDLSMSLLMRSLQL
ncbi:hypothetical protein, partial [Chryseobacterium sp. CH1]|uniref:hypothetical protein n=1 Tax=Chryseobacterium sp. CH1 TaxID=713551 RepID=UPI0010255D6C